MEELVIPQAAKQGIQVFIKRDDLIHPVISGNKWRKLKYNLEKARQEDYDTLLTFGGAWSNHLHATAFAGKLWGFKTIGIIRGERPAVLSNTLQDAEENGMHLEFISRELYRKKEETEMQTFLHLNFGTFYSIPEGGMNAEGIHGCRELMAELNFTPDYICLPCGTGATLAGIVSAAPSTTEVLGFSALKNGNFLKEQVDTVLADIKNNFSVISDYSIGGYAKTSLSLYDFITGFYVEHRLLLDPVYTGKMMMGVIDLLEKEYFKPGSRIVIVHTGGLQGIRGYPPLCDRLRQLGAV